MIITHLTHSTFLVESDKAYILFDYFGKGFLPKDIKKNIYIFSSHSHQDHFDMKIFELFGDKPKAFFILSYDIKRKFGNKIKTEYPKCQDNITYMMPDKHIEINDMHIETIGSTDAGVAYFIEYDNKTFFHSGDLHLWTWKEESADYNEKMKKRYFREMKKIHNKKINYAFYPVDLRQAEDYDIGIRYFLENTQTEKVFPMHYFGDYLATDMIFKNDSLSKYYGRILKIEHENQSFNFEEEK
jgi:L-ascorbate metabolism protein UlaG (beta-lactamase superfamily)